MKTYKLKQDETVLYKGYVFFGKDEKSGELVLTNFNLVFERITKKLFSKEEIQLYTYPLSDIKIYENMPQIKHNKNKIQIFMLNEEIYIYFSSYLESQKFYSAIIKLLTGTTSAERGSEKVKNVIDLVDNTLGIDSVKTIKDTMENGIAGSFVGGITKSLFSPKSNSKRSNHSSTTEVIVQEAAGIAKEAISTKAENKNIEHSISEDDPIEQIKKYKELLDLDIITQEEFNEKKKTLLQL